MTTRNAKLQRIMSKINNVSSTWKTKPIDSRTWETNPTEKKLEKWLEFATIMSKLNDVNKKWTTNPTEKDHERWVDFATTYAPQIDVLQTTVSRISASSLVLAAHHEYTVTAEAHLRYEEEPHVRPVYTITLKKAAEKHNEYLETLEEDYPWVVAMCTLTWELRKLYKQSGKMDIFFEMEAYYKCFCDLLESLYRDYELFHPGVLMDALIDYDSCVFTATLLRKTLHELFALLNSQ